MSGSPISCQKHLFDIPEDVSFLNCAYISPLMKSVQAAMREGMHAESQPWKIHSVDFYDPPETARREFAKLINAHEDNIALIPAASYGLATAAANYRFKPAQKILTLQDQYPSNVYTWHKLAERCDCEVMTIQRPEDDDWTQAVLVSIDETTAIAALPNIHWMDGARLDLEAISGRLREVGAKLVLDVSQSLGALPFDIRKIQADYLVCAGYKWLMCPYGVSFMYVSESRWHDTPIEESPHNRINGHDFPNMYKFEVEYRRGARRFDVGERANFSTLPGAITALRQLNDWGVQNIQTSLSLFTQEVANRANELNLEYLPAGLRANHFIGLRFPQGIPSDLTKTLSTENIFVSQRGDSLRVTPHLYNETSDIKRLFDAIAKFVQR